MSFVFSLTFGTSNPYKEHASLFLDCFRGINAAIERNGTIVDVINKYILPLQALCGVNSRNYQLLS